MSSTVFTPLTKEIDIVPSSTDGSGNALPPGEALASVTLGIRPDGSAVPDPVTGTYPNLVVVPAPATVETKAALLAALTSLGAGNYWLSAQQIDTLSGANFTSKWATEVPFSVPPQGVAPAPPALSVS